MELNNLQENIWYEELPKYCPPEDAFPPQSRIFYRVSEGNPSKDSDFFSQRKLQPQKQFNVDECIARAVSVFENKSDAERIAKLPKFKGCVIAEIALTEKDGLIKKTFSKSHYSWWRTKYFNYRNSNIIQL